MKFRPDQSDVTTGIEALSAEADRFEAALAAASKPVPARPKCALGDPLHDYELMDAHVAVLKATCNLSGVKISESPRPGASCHSSSKSQGGPAPGANSGEKLNATQRILERKGVKSLDELAALKPEQPELNERQRKELEAMLPSATGATRQIILKRLGK